MQPVLAVILSIVLFGALSQFAVAAEEYAGDGLKLRIAERAEKKLSGAIEFAGKSYPFTAESADRGFIGTFSVDDNPFEFQLTEAAGKPGEFILETGDKQYALRKAGANPLAKPNPPAQPNQPAQPNEPVNPQNRNQPGENPGGHTIVLEPAVLRDPKTQLDFCTMLLPKGWRAEGKMWWRPGASCYVTNISEIVDPQNGLAIRFLPIDHFVADPVLFQNARQQGVPPVSAGMELTERPMNAVEFLQNVVLPRYRQIPNLKVVGVQELPQLAQTIERNSMLVVVGRQMGNSCTIQAVRMRVEYADQAGNVFEEEFLCSHLLTWNDRMVAAARQVGMPGAVMFWPLDVVSFSAPKGKLDASLPLMRTVVGSMRTTLRWDAFIATIERAKQQINLNDAAIAAAANAEISDIQRRTWEERHASEERIAMSRGDNLSGTQRFNEPNQANTQVTLPAGYGHAWSNGQGAYVITDDANFKPVDQPQIFTGNWNPMTPSP